MQFPGRGESCQRNVHKLSGNKFQASYRQGLMTEHGRPLSQYEQLMAVYLYAFVPVLLTAGGIVSLSCSSIWVCMPAYICEVTGILKNCCLHEMVLCSLVYIYKLDCIWTICQAVGSAWLWWYWCVGCRRWRVYHRHYLALWPGHASLFSDCVTSSTQLVNCPRCRLACHAPAVCRLQG